MTAKKTQPQAEEAKAAEELKAKEAAKRPEYVVAPGKALTSKRGVIGPGEEIKNADLHGGRDTVRKFIKSGHIVKG